jgi:hypothetical protein
MHKKLTIPLLLSCILGLTACGGGSGGTNNGDKEGGDTNPAEIDSNKEIILSPSLGKIIEGRAVLKNALTGRAITDIQNIDADGTVTFKLDSNKLKDPIIAEILPSTAGKLIYADEAITDKLVTIDAAANTAILRAATTITTNKTNLGITALTEAAVAYAESQRFSVDSINAANKMVQTQLNLTKFNITDAPAIIGLNDFTPLANISLNEQQRIYAAYLATLAKEIKRLHPNSTQPAYEVAQALKKRFIGWGI